MLIFIEKNTIVKDNENYLTIEEGFFEPTDFVICRLKNDENNKVMFLAQQIKEVENESSN